VRGVTEIFSVEVVVMVVCKSGKAIAIEIDCEGVVGDAERIDTHVELPASEEERVEDVSLADIVLGGYVLVGALPLVDFADLVEDEDALALAFRGLGGGGSTGFMIQSILSLFWRLNSS
jgi:hypothetical protein